MGINKHNHASESETALSPSFQETDQAAPAYQTHRLLLTVIACVVYGAFALTANGWGPLLTPLATQFSLSLEQAGLLFVVWSVGYLPGALVGGSLLDIFGPRFMFFTAFLFVLSGMGALLLAATFHLSWLFGLVLCAGLAGVGGGTIDACANGFMSSLYPHKRGAALNLFTALYPLSAMVISLVDGALLLFFHNDPRPSLLFTLCICFLAFVFVFLLPHAPRKQEKGIQKPHLSFSSPLLKESRGIVSILLPVSIAIILTTGFTATIRTWTPAYLYLTYGQTPAFAALLSGLMNGLVLCFRLVVSFLVERIGTRATILLGIGVAIGGLVAALGSHSNVLAGTISLTVTAIGLTPLVATFMALGNERAAGRFSGSVTGLVLFLAGISNVMWSWLFGVILSREGSIWAIMSCLVPLCCGALVVFGLRKKREGNKARRTNEPKTSIG